MINKILTEINNQPIINPLKNGENIIEDDATTKRITDSFEVSGIVSLSGGTVTISNGRFSTGSSIVVTPKEPRSVTSSGVTTPVQVTAKCNSGFCTITSDDSTDNREINYRIFV